MPSSPEPANSAELPLKSIRVLDLTLARAGPTCVRHLADWGADVIRIELPKTGGEGLTGNSDGFDYQNLHRNKRAIKLEPQERGGQEDLLRAGRQGRRRGREHAAGGEVSPRRRLRDRERDQSAHRLRLDLGLRPGRAVRPARGRRPDRPGHGRPDVDHRRARAAARCGWASRSPTSPPAISWRSAS